jgi:serine/threonine protein kinase
MSSTTTFKGQRDEYALPDQAALPQAVGRASLIYRASAANGSEVCIKVYTDPDARPGLIPAGQGNIIRGRHDSSDFGHEFRAYGQLEHPNILPLLDYGHESNSDALFLVLPWCAGGDLRQAMSMRQFFPLTDALPILQRVAFAIDYAHARGFTHGDIKPENILFSTNPTHPFLSDFGSARRAAFVERVSSERAGTPGTTAYLSPEQIDTDVTLASSDIYAFATVAYEMLASRLPVNIDLNPYRQMTAKVAGNITPAREANPQLPSHVADALMKGLSTDPKDRPSSAAQLCQMLAGEVPVSGTKRAKGLKAKTRTGSAGLTGAQKVAVWTAIITVIGTIAVAAVNILPSLRQSGTQSASAKK